MTSPAHQASHFQLHGTIRQSPTMVILFLFICLLHLKASIVEALHHLNCDPCIDRTSYTIRAIVPPSSTSATATTILDPLLQTAEDMNVVVDVVEAVNDADILAAIQTTNPELVDALVVTAPTSEVEETILSFMNENPHFPVFGWGWGYKGLASENVLGWVADDADAGGRQTSHELQSIHNANGTNEVLNKVALIHSRALSAATITRWNAFLDEQAGEAFVGYDIVSVASDLGIASSAISESKLSAAFLDCPYQAVLVVDAAALETLLDIRSLRGCDESTLVAVILDDIDTSYYPVVYQAITRGQIAFALNGQVNLQVTLTFLMAAVYVSTGKVVAMPIESSTYWSGPVLINVDNVPSDTVAECERLSFPVCITDDLSEEEDDGVIETASCSCTKRKAIRIGGVLHGDTLDAFWDPVFAAAEIAANDMNVDLDLKRFQPQESMTLISEQMSARIRNLCDSGIDGLFVTIPDDTVKAAVQRCHDLRVPVVSINSGKAASEELRLPHHIGQEEYSGGYGAGVRLIDAGMKTGYCIDHHASGNSALVERCQGFQDAIEASPKDVAFGGSVAVPGDNMEQYIINVETAVEATGGSWEGVGLLGFGADRIPALLRVLEKHPGTVAGSFDTSDAIYESVRDGKLLFGIDQQPHLQGQLPIYLLTYMIYTQQALTNHVIQSGPSFVQEYPSEAQKVCEANLFAVCPDRPEEDMTFISDSFLAFGYVLFGLLAWSCMIAFAWTYKYRSKWVVKVSQPMFLHLVVCGCLLSGLSILFMGVQTAYRYDQDTTGAPLDQDNPDIGMVDAACMAVPWLWGLGFVATFSALFAKIHRVKLIYLAGMQMKRKQVSLSDVLPVMAIMFVIEFVILLSWQLVAPLRWQREVTDELDGYPTASVGSCDGGQQGWRFYGGLVGFHVCCLAYALILCFQTKDINSDFAESSYVSLAVAFMFQVLVLAVPISALVRDSTDVMYFVKAIAIFLQNFTVLVLIFVPKMFRVSEEHRNPSSRSQRATSLQRTPRPSRCVSWAAANMTDRSREVDRSNRSVSFRVGDEDPSCTQMENGFLNLSNRSRQVSGTASSGPDVLDRDSNAGEHDEPVHSRRGKPVLPEDVEAWERLGFPSQEKARVLLQILRERSLDTQTNSVENLPSDDDDATPPMDSESSTPEENPTPPPDKDDSSTQSEKPPLTKHCSRVNFVGEALEVDL